MTREAALHLFRNLNMYSTLKMNYNINTVWSEEEEEETRLQFYGMFVFLYFTIYADLC